MTAQICVQISVLLLTAPSRPHSLLHKNKHLPRATIRIWFGSRGRGKNNCSVTQGGVFIPQWCAYSAPQSSLPFNKPEVPFLVCPESE